MYHFRRNARPHAGTLVIGTLLVALAATSTPAQDRRAPPGQGATNNDRAALISKLQSQRRNIAELNGRLQEIREQTLAAKPELKSRHEAFREMMRREMEKAGYDADAEMAKIERLQEQIRKAEGTERRELGRQLQQAQQRFQQAQQKAFQNEEVKAAAEALQRDMTAAIVEQDPEAKQLLQELRQAQLSHRSTIQQAVQQNELQGGRSTN